MDFSFLNFSNFNVTVFLEYLVRLIFDFIVIFIVAKLIYFKIRKNSNILFSLLLINIIVFSVCYLLQSVQLTIGFAFGIFAVFSILRYRTQQIPIKDMTYIFISISLAIFNALTNIETGYEIMLFTNIMIIITIYIFEKKFIRNEASKIIVYEKIDLIKPENHQQLLEDLSQRTGLIINRFEIGRIDFMRDTARIKIYYFDNSGDDEDGSYEEN